MEKQTLFNEFEPLSSAKWKQQIQYELKGADFNQTVVWESAEGIKVKPFYHFDETIKKVDVNTTLNSFRIVQNIFVHDVFLSNRRAMDSLHRGAESIRFTIVNEAVSLEDLMQNLPLEKTTYFFYLPFLSIDFVNRIDAFAVKNSCKCVVEMDPIGQLCKDGNWFENETLDFENLQAISEKSNIPFLYINAGIYQNAGANMVQQLAYTLAHINEYFNRVKDINQPIAIEIAVGTNYFFEMAKLKALRLLFNTLAAEYDHHFDCHILVTPTKRNKTLYDYNVNMLRTTTECMSAILGGANSIANLPYDALYHKDNEFGDRIARNQLLVLKHESYFDKVSNPTDGAYYVESLTNQMADKALTLFKEIEEKGGFIAQLLAGNIQKKVNESAAKEQELFDNGTEILLGTNKFPNKNDTMKHDLELYPFVKQHPRKTLIIPIIEKRLAEKMEQERLKLEES